MRQAASGYLTRGIPHDASPAGRNAWWVGLTDEHRGEYLSVYPDQIGNLDGIPALVRDAANRDNLQLLMGKPAGRDDDDAVTMPAALREIDRQLQVVPKPGEPPMYLLGIGDQGNGAIYARTRDGFGVRLRMGGKVKRPSRWVAHASVSPKWLTPSVRQFHPLMEGVEFIFRPNIHSDFWSAGASEAGVTSGS